MNAQEVLDWALQTGLMISVIIAVILLIRRPVTRWFGAGAAYALWLLPVIRLLMPPVTLPKFWASWLPKSPELAAPNPQNFIPAIRPQTPDIAPSLSAPPFDFSLIIVIIWLAIAGLWFAYQMLQHINHIQNLRLATEPATPELTHIIQSSMRDLSINRTPNIRMSHDGVGPMVTRFWNPIIVVPADFTQKYNQAQQSFALTHEMAHVKRFDLWAALAALVFRAINWPNPLVHYAAHKFLANQEAACDAYLLAKLGGGQNMKQDYARTLMMAAKYSDPISPNAPLGLALSGHIKSEPTHNKTEISKGDMR